MPYKRDIDQSVSIKVVAYQPSNITVGLPTIVATTSLYDSTTGHLVALSDGVFLTAVRTGAASAIVSSILAHPNSITVGLVGAGAQAITQLHALSRVFPLQSVLVYDINRDTAQSFLSRAAFMNLPIQVAPLDQVEREADILCTATTVAEGEGPVIIGEYLKPHVHINAIGSDLPGKTELPLSLLKTSLVCPDFPEQAKFEGECQQLTTEEIGPDLLKLVRRPEDFHIWREQRTVFDSTGMGLEDHVALASLLEFVQEYGLGQHVQLEFFPTDPYNPYEMIENSMLIHR
jgi:ornithine cyclodeaminase/alanine dehydrogenase-like protein (mu-crystallin family)